MFVGINNIVLKDSVVVYNNVVGVAGIILLLFVTYDHVTALSRKECYILTTVWGRYVTSLLKINA